jgi:SAM-dependent methyltransferase
MPTAALASLLEVHQVLMKVLPKGPIAIFEAGGGSTSYLPKNINERAEITVVDIDPVQISRNTYAHHLIQGDIQTYRFPSGRFDLVVCYNVIEHLPDVAAALEGFFMALKPGGLVLIGAPYPRSLSGFVAKWTPHSFHVWFCRQVLGWPNAGELGSPPFPTIFHSLVDPLQLVPHAIARGFELIHLRVYESPRYSELRSHRPVFARLLDLLAKALNAVGGNRSDVRRGDYHLILRRKT